MKIRAKLHNFDEINKKKRNNTLLRRFLS